LTTITTIAALDAAIGAANAGVANTGTITIDLGGTIALGTTALTEINLKAGTTLDLVGGGAVLNGGGTERGLFVYAGAVDIANLTLENMDAQGGSASSNGGGGGGGGDEYSADDGCASDAALTSLPAA